MKPRPAILAVLLFSMLVGMGVPAAATDHDGHIEIIAVEGHLDRRALDFVADRIQAAAAGGASAAIIQLDSAASLSENVHHLALRIADPPLPLVVWVGPSPAVAFGGAAHLLAAAPVRAAAPGVRIGYALPAVAGGSPVPGPTAPPDALSDAALTVREPVEGMVDIVAPSISNLLVELEGLTVTVRGSDRTLRTTRETGDGVVAIDTVFYEPGPGTRLLRVATDVEAAFFFLMIGLAVAAFEFYALGPGIAAGVAAVSLLIAGYGLSVLPLRGWAVALALLGIGLLTADFQRGRSGPLTAAGAAAMLVGGLFFTDASPQITPSWEIVLVTVISVTAFYVIGMRTVARARFSTPTVGRSHLIGRAGRAVTPFDPDGVAEVEGGRWRATAHRAARLGPGDPLVVRGVHGSVLEVEPAEIPLQPPPA